MTRYIVNKYEGRKYWGNAFCETFNECMAFADDGICTRCKIRDTKTGKLFIIKIEEIDVYFD